MGSTTQYHPGYIIGLDFAYCHISLFDVNQINLMYGWLAFAKSWTTFNFPQIMEAVHMFSLFYTHKIMQQWKLTLQWLP